jgi:predicted permease
MGVLQNEVGFTIASGASLSGAGFLGAGMMSRLRMPAAWTAAVITFATSYDNVLYQPLCDAAGVEISITVAASTDVALPAVDGITYLKVRSGTSAAGVNQGADRAISIITNKPLRR